VIEQLHHFFGVIGVASVALWLAALLFVVVAVPFRKRTLPLWLAFALAVAGLGTAWVNTVLVDRIRIDYDAEAEILRKARADAAREAVGSLKDRAAKIQFAEDSPEDQLDLAGVKDPENRYEEALRDTESTEYLYRQQGKKRRTRQANADSAAAKDAVPATGGGDNAGREGLSEQIAEEGEPEGRKMLHAELKVVQYYDKLNMIAARFAFCLTLVLVIVDYLLRFNDLSGAMYPLPIAGAFTDALSRKSHSVMLKPGSTEAVAAFLVNAVRRGENFILFGAGDPWGDAILTRTPVGCWSVHRQTLSATAGNLDEAFVFESAWFGRSCFVIEDADGSAALPVIDKLVQFLEVRRMARASARRLVNIVWAHRRALPSEAFAELRMLCEEENLRILVIEPEQGSESVVADVDRCIAVDRPSLTRGVHAIDAMVSGLSRWAILPVACACATFARQVNFLFRSAAVALSREKAPPNLLPTPQTGSDRRTR